MSNLTLKEIYDHRTMGELDDGVPLRIWVHCLSDDGAEYKGWYYFSTSKPCPVDSLQYYFHQCKLSFGKYNKKGFSKTCCRKVSAKINKSIINLIEANKSKVTDYGLLWKKVKMKEV